MTPLPQFLTKHCRPQDRERMLAGGFKIGTHATFFNAERATGLYGDADEGKGHSLVNEALPNFSGTVLGATFFGSNIGMGLRSSIAVSHEVNLNVFCTSIGPYDRARHERLIERDAEILAWIVLDRMKLSEAMNAVTRDQFAVQRMIERHVSYDGREVKFPRSAMDANLDRAALAKRDIDFAFAKPPAFSIEEEYRHCIVPSGKRASPILTVNMPVEIREAFREAIADIGGVLET